MIRALFIVLLAFSSHKLVARQNCFQSLKKVSIKKTNKLAHYIVGSDAFKFFFKEISSNSVVHKSKIKKVIGNKKKYKARIFTKFLAGLLVLEAAAPIVDPVTEKTTSLLVKKIETLFQKKQNKSIFAVLIDENPKYHEIRSQLKRKDDPSKRITQEEAYSLARKKFKQLLYISNILETEREELNSNEVEFESIVEILNSKNEMSISKLSQKSQNFLSFLSLLNEGVFPITQSLTTNLNKTSTNLFSIADPDKLPDFSSLNSQSLELVYLFIQQDLAVYAEYERIQVAVESGKLDSLQKPIYKKTINLLRERKLTKNEAKSLLANLAFIEERFDLWSLLGMSPLDERGGVISLKDFENDAIGDFIPSK